MKDLCVYEDEKDGAAEVVASIVENRFSKPFLNSMKPMVKTTRPQINFKMDIKQAHNIIDKFGTVVMDSKHRNLNSKFKDGITKMIKANVEEKVVSKKDKNKLAKDIKSF